MKQVCGRIKMDRKTKSLVERLSPGDVAVIDHRDIDEIAAESLVQKKVRAVVNINSSMSGRYPNNGPRKLAEANIPHFDLAGEEFYSQINDGDMVAIHRGNLYLGEQRVGSARVVDAALIERQLSRAERNLGNLLDSFVQNTLEYALREKELILGGIDFPSLSVKLAGMHVLVVVRGQSYREDLHAIAHYLDEVKPVLIGVDGGADALLEFGRIPDLIVGDMDSVSDQALKRAREILVHAYPDGKAPGLARTESLGLNASVVKAPGTSEDIALLLAYEKGAKLIAAVGTHSNMIDFLEKGRKGMASTFLVRLKIGSKFIDARGVSQLYRSRVSGRSMVLLALAASIPMLVLALSNPTIRHIFKILAMRLGSAI